MVAACLAAVFWGWACSPGDEPSGPRAPGELRTQLVIESAPAGLEQAVVVDTASWFPAALVPAGDELVEVEGPFRIVFRNTSTRTVELRYDLRFLDEDGFLIDRFIPFGLPVVLGARQQQVEEGTFVVRARPGTSRFDLASMRIAARLTAP